MQCINKLYLYPIEMELLTRSTHYYSAACYSLAYVFPERLLPLMEYYTASKKIYPMTEHPRARLHYRQFA